MNQSPSWSQYQLLTSFSFSPTTTTNLYMKRIAVRDILGNTSSYCYVRGSLASHPAIVFVQGPQSRSTSITNLIEDLATAVVAVEFPGTEPSAVRFFEYYSPDQNPLFVWQEVVFEELVPQEGELGFFGKLAEMVFGKSPPSAWSLEKPQWRQPLSPSEKTALETLLVAAQGCSMAHEPNDQARH